MSETIASKNEQTAIDISEYFKKGKDAYNEKKYDLAFSFFRITAEEGNTRAQFYMGILYNFGYGVPQDYVKANYWYELAAKQNKVSAIAYLGEYYCFGKGVAPDIVKGLSYLEKAASLGSDYAIKKLKSFNIGYNKKLGLHYIGE